jgi:hypothetical protein
MNSCQYRGKGVGTWTLLQFLELEHVRTDDTVVCWPTPVGIRDKSLFNTTRNAQIAFFRKVRLAPSIPNTQSLSASLEPFR